MNRGDTTILKNGVYNQKDVASLPRITDADIPAPSGTSYITFQGESFEVVNGEFVGVVVTSQSAISLDGVTRVKLQNIIFKNGTEGSAFYNVDVTSCVFKNIGIKNGAQPSDTYAEVFLLTATAGNTSGGNLLEDVFVIGTGRYQVVVGAGQGYSQYNVLRRVLTRLDYHNTGQPIAGISNYGDTGSILGARHNYIQNAIAIDYNPSSIFPNSTPTAAFYNPWGADHIDFYGNIALNIPYRAYQLQEGGSEGSISLRQSTNWRAGFSDANVIVNNNSSATLSTLDHVTIASSPVSGVGLYNSVAVNMTNSLAYQVDQSDVMDDDDYNHYYPDSARPASGSTNYTNSSITPDCMVDVTGITSNGNDGAPRGAVILKRMGTDGTLLGETGWNTLSSVDLWPWPNELVIKTVAAWPDEGAWATAMSANTEARGFASISGDYPLTTYINDWITDNGCGFDSLMTGGGSPSPSSGGSVVGSLTIGGRLDFNWR